MAAGDSKSVSFNSPQFTEEDSSSPTNSNSKIGNGHTGDLPGNSFEGDLDLEEARKISEATVDEVISLAEKADEVKEHDVAEEEEAEAQRLKDEMDKELEENDGWVKILGNDELMKKVIKGGLPNMNPLRGDVCTLKVVGKLFSDESITFEDNPLLEVHLGDAEIIPGLDLSIPLMTKGEVALIRVSQRFGYGAKGHPPHVPPAADLLYEVELLNYDTEPELSELSVELRRSIGNRKRERGNWWYGRGESSLAVQCYRRALEFLDEVEGGIQFPSGNGTSEEITPEIRLLFEDRLKTLNNMAMAQLKLQAYEPALNSVEAVLKCQPNNSKALYRKGKILGEKGETEKAIRVLQRALELEPKETSISAEINRLSQRRKKEHQSEKQLYKRMFQDSPKGSEDKDPGERKKGSSLKSTLSLGLVLSGVAIALAGMMAYRYRLF